MDYRKKCILKATLDKDSNWKKCCERVGIYHSKLFGMPNDTMPKTEMLINILQDLSLASSSTGTSTSTGLEKPESLDEILKTFVDTEFYKQHKELFSALFHAAIWEDYMKVAEICLTFDQSLASKSFKEYEEPVSILLSAEFDKLFSLLEKSESSIFEVDTDGLTILHSLRKTAPENIFHYYLKFLGTLWETTTANTDGASSFSAKPTSLTELFNWPTKTTDETPLHYAVNLDTDILELFLRGGRKPPAPIIVNLNAVDSNGNTALLTGLKQRCSLDNIECLVEYGADFKTLNYKRCNVAHICAQQNLPEHLQYLIELGVNVNEVDSMGNSALQCGLANLSGWYTGKDLYELVAIFLCVGVNKEQVNFKNQTVLDIAKTIRYPKKIWDMLNKSVNKVGDSRIKKFETFEEIEEKEQKALFKALEQSVSLDEIKTLVNSGIDFKSKNKEGCNVAHICARKCLPDHLEYFIEKGVNVNEVDSKGNNALQCALIHFLRNKFTELEIPILLVLEDAGVNKSQVNLENKTAYDIAKETGRWCDSLVEMFKGDYTSD